MYDIINGTREYFALLLFFFFHGKLQALSERIRNNEEFKLDSRSYVPMAEKEGKIFDTYENQR